MNNIFLFLSLFLSTSVAVGMDHGVKFEFFSALPEPLQLQIFAISDNKNQWKNVNKYWNQHVPKNLVAFNLAICVPFYAADKDKYVILSAAHAKHNHSVMKNVMYGVTADSKMYPLRNNFLMALQENDTEKIRNVYQECKRLFELQAKSSYGDFDVSYWGHSYLELNGIYRGY